MTRTIEVGGQGAPLHERRIIRQKVATVEVTAPPYAVPPTFVREEVVAEWEQLPPAERTLTAADRKALKEANRVGPRVGKEQLPQEGVLLDLSK